MIERPTRFGIGPRIVEATLAYVIVAGAATYAWPGVCMTNLPSFGFVIAAGVLLVALGVTLWLAGVIAVMRAYDRDELVTSGVFGLVRHPVYAGWIVLILPGLSLLSGSWPLLFTPFVAAGMFRALIHREDAYLEQRFGQRYLDYKDRVNELFPAPRGWSRIHVALHR